MKVRDIPEWVWVLLLVLIFVFAETLVGQVHAAELPDYGYQEPVAADWSKAYGYQEPPPKRCNIWCRGWRARVEDAATGRGWARGNSGQRDQYGRPVKVVPQ